MNDLKQVHYFLGIEAADQRDLSLPVKVCVGYTFTRQYVRAYAKEFSNGTKLHVSTRSERAFE